MEQHNIIIMSTDQFLIHNDWQRIYHLTMRKCQFIAPIRENVH